MTIARTLAASALALALGGGAALAGAHLAAERYDADADGLITEDEFGTGFGGEGIFGGFDSDADGMLNEEEFGVMGDRAALTDYDSDTDGLVSEDEFNTGMFGGYDADASGDLDETEVVAVDEDFGDDGLFDFD